MPSEEQAAAIPSATVVPLREGDGGLEVLMLRREASLTSFAGMWVFPGGRIDPHDEVPGDELATARRAAAREAAEEADLLVDPHKMVPFSHWTPPVRPGRRFATWFFLAPVADDHDGTVRVDGGEVDDHLWLPPGEALGRRDAGEIELAPPTAVTLTQLSVFSSAAEALEHPHVVERYQTVIAHGSEPLTLLWHGDAGYEHGDADRPGPRHRLVCGVRWEYVRDPSDD